MSGDELDPRELVERQKARLLEDAAAGEARAAAQRAAAAALDGQFAALQQLASALGFAVVPAPERGRHAFDGSVWGLVDGFETHPESSYHGGRHATRAFYARLNRRIKRDLPGVRISDLNRSRLEALYRQWSNEGKTLYSAHALFTMLRSLATFGHEVLKDDACTQLRVELHLMKVPMGKKAPTQPLTEAQALGIIRVAHEMGYPSVALAQAFQFWCKLGQKDAIGEWVPVSERTAPSEYIRGDKKWARGLRCNEIDLAAKMLRHPASIDGKLLEIRLPDIVMAELDKLPDLPPTGALILYERSKMPWGADTFRRIWREAATRVGVPKSVRNGDRRSRGNDPASEAEEIEETDSASEMRR